MPHFRFMAIKWLSTIGLAYGWLMLILGAALSVFTLHGGLEGEESPELMWRVVISTHGLAQILYTLSTRSRLSLPVYESTGTLDNEWMFGAENRRVYRNPAWAVAMASYASCVALLIAYVSAAGLGSISLVSAGDGAKILSTLVSITGLLGALPAVVYNVRTWNMRRVITD
jgi:hypothetical protein